MGTSAPTPAVTAATTAVTAGDGDLVRVLAHRCALTRAERPISRHALLVRTLVPGSSAMRKDLTSDVVAVADGLGELALTSDELVFTTASGERRRRREDIDEIQYLHGLVIVGDDAYLVDPDDQLDLLAAWDPAWGGQDLTVLALPPDDLLDELAALDEDAVAASVPTPLPPPRADQRIDVGAAEDGVAADEIPDDGPGLGTRIADVASSTTTEEVAATVGKMLGVNKGTTRSLFRAWRKGRR